MSYRILRHFCLRLSVVIGIRSALRSPYPAGNGSAVFSSMPPNNHRVWCPFARGNPY